MPGKQNTYSFLIGNEEEKMNKQNRGKVSLCKEYINYIKKGGGIHKQINTIFE